MTLLERLRERGKKQEEAPIIEEPKPPRYVCRFCGSGEEFLAAQREWHFKTVRTIFVRDGKLQAGPTNQNVFYPGEAGPVEQYSCRTCGTATVTFDELVRDTEASELVALDNGDAQASPPKEVSA